jgi:ATP-dependent RNA helicase RhlE
MNPSQSNGQASRPSSRPAYKSQSKPFTKPHAKSFAPRSSSRPFGRPTFGSSGGSNSFGSKPFGGRPLSRYSKPFGRPQGKRFGGQFIDSSRFINKAVITEKVEHFVPEHAFIDFAIDENLKKNIVTKGYVTPTPIQDKSIPHILRGSDVVGIANTGTGKTAAFLIPLIHKVLYSRNNPVNNPRPERVLVVVPTRELAQQIESEFRGFTPHLNMHAVVCVGGANMYNQISSLKRAHSFIIGTPGRLRDLIDRKCIDLDRYATVVLDEADRMLDMGFITDIKYMVSKMPPTRHTLFFSATMSSEIKALIKDFLKEPVMISVKTSETSSQVEQDVIRVPAGKNKLDVLEDLLRKPGFGKVLIFGRTKHGVERLAKELMLHGFKAESIHGNKTQGQRQKALSLFKENHAQILVATDVAARGLDISGVTHVINFEVPSTYEDYVHRIGRTGRAGKRGVALTFI